MYQMDSNAQGLLYEYISQFLPFSSTLVPYLLAYMYNE